MNITDVKEYLASHEKARIETGKSGAEIWDIEGKYILKHVRRAKLPDPEIYERYRNEAYFYRFVGQNRCGELLFCLPQVLDVQASADEIIILMKKYGEPSRNKIDEKLLRRIMRTLAVIHAQDIPDFLRRERRSPEYPGEKQIQSCLEGWQSVLAEHPGEFDERILTDTAEKINEIITWHCGEEQVLSHGDFHWDNLLAGENGDILICDWQGVNAGGASGDISFFLSRLRADGIVVEQETVAELYCQEKFRMTGEKISPEELQRHMNAANVITSFLFWHQYLHGSTAGRVREIYEKMVM